MKTLKVGALALGMMFVGSAMAMKYETKQRAAIEDAIEQLIVEIASIAEKTTNTNLKAQIEQRVTTAREKVASMLKDDHLNDIDALAPLEALRDALMIEKAQYNVIATSVVNRTGDLIKTHPKKLGVLAAVAVVTAAYLVYKKFTAKKKIQVVEQDEIDETEEVTLK